jgi:hypothetical protein
MNQKAIGEGWRRLRIVTTVTVACLVSAPLGVFWAWVMIPYEETQDLRVIITLAGLGLLVVGAPLLATWLLVTGVAWVVWGFKQHKAE